MIRDEKMVMGYIFTFNFCNIWKGSKNSIFRNIGHTWKALFSYDYAIGEQKDNNGLTRVATILKQQRKENKNVIKKSNNKPFVKPYVIKKVDGVRVAIVGYLVPHIPIWEASTPEHFEGLKFLGPEEALSATLKELEGKYDVLIGSFHLGREDEKGGKVTPELDNNWEVIKYNFNNPLLPKLAEKLKDGSIKIPTSSDGRTLNVKSIKESEVK